MNWTKQAIIEAGETLPPVPNNEELWARVWTRSVREFGLAFYCPTPELPYDLWSEKTWGKSNLKKIRVDRILFSTQPTVRLDVLYWYLRDPIANMENFDTDGWFGNDRPVLIALPNGKYVVKDGNHRVITRKLERAQTIDAYVMKGK